MSQTGAFCFALLAIGLLGAVLALIIHRPDSDDYYYIPNAVYYLQNPNMKMGFDIHFFHVHGLPFVSHMTNTSFPYEYTQAGIAYFTGIDFLSIYYILFPAIIGFLIPISLFYALSHFSVEPRNNAVGVLFTVGVILILGETHRTYGNLSFAKAFQGKISFLSVGIPTFIAFSFDYFKKISPLSCAALAAVSTSSIGMTASASIILLGLSLIMSLLFLYKVKSLKRSVLPLVFYFLMLGYVAIYALAIRKFALSYAGMDSPQNQGWPVTFMGHLNFLINSKMPMTPIFAVIATATSLIFCGKRKELLIWIGTALLLFLNPFVAPPLIKYVTSPNIYWRLFYILPFPLVIGIGVSSVLDRWPAFVKGGRLVIVALAGFLFLLMLHYPLRKASVFRPSNNVKVGWPGYKLDMNDLQAARKIVRIAPHGIMLAPADIAGIITMVDSRYPQMRARDHGIKTWLTYRGRRAEAELRIEASDFVAGYNLQFDALKELILLYPDLRSMVIQSSVWGRGEVRNFLIKDGYTSYQEINSNCTLVWKP